ncbi:MAG: EFR1 family ferrodoxin [Bacteroidaceae bacterium]|nr:EFR1 family ferrodoxin [Bacteroidaceae bacterium]
MSRRDALKTMGAFVATAAMATTGLSSFTQLNKKGGHLAAARPKRLVFYFTATGNSLYVARQLSAESVEPLSIPQVLKGQQMEFEAEEIGIVYPDFAAAAPLMVREFVEKVKLKTPYLFSVITFGNFAANVADWWNDFCLAKGVKHQYINTLLMVDNYLPVFDMNEQVKIDKHIPENLAVIVADVNGRKEFISHVDSDDRMKGWLTNLQNAHFPMEAERLLKLNEEACIACGTCSQVCPHGNFTMTDTAAQFKGGCEYCLACVHACPQKALTLARGERNPQARYRNENISLGDIKRANNQQK